VEKKKHSDLGEGASRAVDPEGAWYMVAGPDGTPATISHKGERVAVCGIHREVAERVIAMAPGKGLIIQPVYPREYKSLERMLAELGVRQIIAGLFKRATEGEIADETCEVVESEEPPAYVIDANDLIRVLREFHEGKRPLPGNGVS
jgi:hypothetical protein